MTVRELLTEMLKLELDAPAVVAAPGARLCDVAEAASVAAVELWDAGPGAPRRYHDPASVAEAEALEKKWRKVTVTRVGAG